MLFFFTLKIRSNAEGHFFSVYLLSTLSLFLSCFLSLYVYSLSLKREGEKMEEGERESCSWKQFRWQEGSKVAGEKEKERMSGREKKNERERKEFAIILNSLLFSLSHLPFFLSLYFSLSYFLTFHWKKSLKNLLFFHGKMIHKEIHRISLRFQFWSTFHHFHPLNSTRTFDSLKAEGYQKMAKDDSWYNQDTYFWWEKIIETMFTRFMRQIFLSLSFFFFSLFLSSPFLFFSLLFLVLFFNGSFPNPKSSWSRSFKTLEQWFLAMFVPKLPSHFHFTPCIVSSHWETERKKEGGRESKRESSTRRHWKR